MDWSNRRKRKWLDTLELLGYSFLLVHHLGIHVEGVTTGGLIALAWSDCGSADCGFARSVRVQVI